MDFREFILFIHLSFYQENCKCFIFLSIIVKPPEIETFAKSCRYSSSGSHEFKCLTGLLSYRETK